MAQNNIIWQWPGRARYIQPDVISRCWCQLLHFHEAIHNGKRWSNRPLETLIVVGNNVPWESKPVTRAWWPVYWGKLRGTQVELFPLPDRK